MDAEASGPKIVTEKEITDELIEMFRSRRVHANDFSTDICKKTLIQILDKQNL
jgi:hypothetical protein